MSMTEAQAQRLAKLVVKARMKKGLTTRELAAQVGVAVGWVNGIEAGRFMDPGADHLARVAEALDIDPSRIDRITKSPVGDSLPELRTYFRAKYDLTPEQIAQVERYVKRFRRAA